MDQLTLLKERLKQVGISDWLEDWDIQNLSDEAAKLEPGQTYLEVGVAFGVSASIALLSSQEGVKVWGLDMINWTARDHNIKRLLELYGMYQRFKDWEFIEGESDVVGRYWHKEQIDLLFIDGDHTYEGCLKDIALWVPWVKHGGVIMFDDYNEKTGVKKAVNEVLRNHKAFDNHKIDQEMYICKKI